MVRLEAQPGLRAAGLAAQLGLRAAAEQLAAQPGLRAAVVRLAAQLRQRAAVVRLAQLGLPAAVEQQRPRVAFDPSAQLERLAIRLRRVTVLGRRAAAVETPPLLVALRGCPAGRSLVRFAEAAPEFRMATRFATALQGPALRPEAPSVGRRAMVRRLLFGEDASPAIRLARLAEMAATT